MPGTAGPTSATDSVARPGVVPKLRHASESPEGSASPPHLPILGRPALLTGGGCCWPRDHFENRGHGQRCLRMRDVRQDVSA